MEIGRAAWEFYLQAREAWRPRTEEGFAQAIDLLKGAIASDPEFAGAHALLSLIHATRPLNDEKYTKSNDFELAQEHAERALALNPNSVEAHFALAWAAMPGRWDWQAFDRYIRAALDIDPNNAYAYFARSFYFGNTGHTQREKEAMERAIELDPFYPLYHWNLGDYFAALGHYDEALAANRRALEVSPDSTAPARNIAWIFARQGKTEEALAAIPAAGDISAQDRLRALANVYARLGMQKEATEALNEHARRFDVLDFPLPVDALALLGREDDALDNFERSISNHSIGALNQMLRIGQSTTLWENPRIWEIFASANVPDFSPEHPAYEHQQRWLADEAAKRVLAAQPKPVGRFTIELSLDRPLLFDYDNAPRPAIAVSQDGTRIVYAAQKGDTSQLYLRYLYASDAKPNLDAFDAKPIPDTDGAYYPFFSPDGAWIGFCTDEGIKKVSITGGAPVLLSPAPDVWGATWTPDNTIVFNPSGSSGFWRISADGGDPDRSFTTLNLTMNDQAHNAPSIGPDDSTVVYSVWMGGSVANNRIETISLTDSTAKPRVILSGGTSPYYTSSGHLVYARANELIAVPMNPAKSELETPVTVFTGILADNRYETPQFAISASGLLVFAAGDAPSTQFELIWIDREGNESVVSDSPGPYRRPDLSPDGKHIVYTNAENQNIWIYNIERGTPTPFTTHPSEHTRPKYSPDGKQLSFGSSREGIFNIFRAPSDGTGEPMSISPTRYMRQASTWTPDGTSLVYVEIQPEALEGIWTIPLNSGGDGERLYDTSAREDMPALSSNGWVAYQSDKSGRAEVYVRKYSENGAGIQVSNSGGKEPFWSSDGSELFYQSLNGDRLMITNVHPAEGPGAPKVLFDKPNVEVWDIDESGDRFLGIRFPEIPPVTRLHVVQNFFEELKRLAPHPKAN